MTQRHLQQIAGTWSAAGAVRPVAAQRGQLARQRPAVGRGPHTVA
ncbi:MAG TPA: hypothetical protein VKY74_11980 [Chloroflexia bacterium]|nr:hypothetical protein [Chloroflexia bacterium]